MTYLPRFAPQNPALSGCPLGWSSCTCFAAQMAADYDTLGAKRPTGCQIRTATGDTVGGTNLAQVDEALRTHWGIDLDVQYRFLWSTFAARIDAGRGAILQLSYGPIAASKFDAGGGFTGNHAIFVPPGWGAMDPLADGRRSGIYKYHGEAYPQSLLKTAAGRLNVAPIGYSALGAGLVYAAFTRDNTKTYRALLPAGSFWVYTVVSGRIIGRTAQTRGGGSAVPCTGPRLYPWTGHSSKSLVMVTKGIYVGRYVSSQYAQEIP